MNVALPSPTSPAPRRTLRRVLFGAAGLLFAAALVVAALPTLVSWSPALRRFLLQQAERGFRGRIEVAELSVGWLSPLRVTGLALRPRSADDAPRREPALSIERVESERSLLGMLLAPDDLGAFRFERPTAFVEFVDGRANFAEMFPPTEKPLPPVLQRLGAKARIVDGALRWKSSATAEPWEITGVNLGVGLRPASRASSGKLEILVDRGTLVDHERLTVGLCDDVLKYVAPVVAEVARTQGEVTIELDDWRLPWNAWAEGELSGRLTMHSVAVGPGPMVQSIFHTAGQLPLVGELVRKIPLPQFVEIARESIVPFKLVAGGRIEHSDLRFSVADVVDVKTRGTVGFDQSLDLVAELGLHPPNADERRAAILRVLTTQAWPVIIRGTFRKPQLDFSALPYAGLQLGGKYLSDLESGKPSIGADVLRALQGAGVPIEASDARLVAELIKRLQSQTTGTSPAAPTDAAREAVGTAFDILQALRERRTQTPPTATPTPGAAPTTAAAPSAGPPTAAASSSAPPVRRPLLRKGLKLLLDAAEQATQPPADPPTPSATPTAPKP